MLFAPPINQCSILFQLVDHRPYLSSHPSSLQVSPDDPKPAHADSLFGTGTSVCYTRDEVTIFAHPYRQQTMCAVAVPNIAPLKGVRPVRTSTGTGNMMATGSIEVELWMVIRRRSYYARSTNTLARCHTAERWVDRLMVMYGVG